MKNCVDKKGMTLAEVLVALILGTIVIGGILTLTVFMHSGWEEEQVKSEIIDQLEGCMERIKKEVRLSDAFKIFFHPTTSITYSAISFPLAVDDDADGFIEVGGTPERIVWDQTVIYHLFTNAQGNTELRRTVFQPRDNTLDMPLRQQQIDEVVANGEPVNTTPNFANWDATNGTRILCESDTITLDISPSERYFDGYNASTEKSENITFGSISLDPGNHVLRFTAEGQNASSSGFQMGIDSFIVSPSGCVIEAEEASISSSSGQTAVNEEMITYGVWNGNRHLEFRAAAPDDFIELDFYYDQWIETNFATCSPHNVRIQYSNRTGDGSEQVGINDCTTRLEGFGDSWSALDQTGAAAKSTQQITVSGTDGIIFRNLILDRSIAVEGRAIKITFDNVSSNAMHIDYAFIMEHAGGPDGDGSTIKLIKFNGNTEVTVPASGNKESDWIDINDFTRYEDYVLTFHVSNTSFPPGTHDISGWTVNDGSVYSYIREGDITAAMDTAWSSQPPGTYTPTDIIYAVESIDASYLSEGTLTSQIYDTQVADPVYGTVAWSIAKDNYGNYGTGGQGATVKLRVRSDDSADVLKANNEEADWNAVLEVDTQSATSGSADISTIGNGRFVQFQAVFTSQETAPGDADYIKSCVLKNVSIRWPGEARLVDLSGYFTRRSDYGIFSIEVDGKSLLKGLEVQLGISKDTRGVASESITRSLTVEAEPRNTGK